MESTRILRATFLCSEVVVDVLRAVGPPARSWLLSQCDEEGSALWLRGRLYRLIPDDVVDLHLNGIAWPDAQNVGRNGKLIVEGELDVVMVPAPRVASTDGDEDEAVVLATLETQLALDRCRNGHKTIFRPVHSGGELSPRFGEMGVCHGTYLVSIRPDVA
jgi:hypothetical protein